MKLVQICAQSVMQIVLIALAHLRTVPLVGQIQHSEIIILQSATALMLFIILLENKFVEIVLFNA